MSRSASQWLAASAHDVVRALALGAPVATPRRDSGRLSRRQVSLLCICPPTASAVQRDLVKGDERSDVFGGAAGPVGEHGGGGVGGGGGGGQGEGFLDDRHVVPGRAQERGSAMPQLVQPDRRQASKV